MLELAEMSNEIYNKKYKFIPGNAVEIVKGKKIL